MRASILVLPLLLCSVPAFAQSAPAPANDARQSNGVVGRDGIDLSRLGQVANAARSASNALLDMKVGSIPPALEGREPTPAERNLTVRDLAHRRDPNFEQHVDQQLAAALPKIERSVKALNEALPEVEDSLAKAKRSLKRAMANMPDPNYPRQ